MPENGNDLERKLWSAADQLRANSRLRSNEYSVPVLGLIFLRYADHKFTIAKEALDKEASKSSRLGITKDHYKAQGVLYLPEKSRYKYLLSLPEGDNVGRAVSDAMKLIEQENEELNGVLPKTYNRLEGDVLWALFKTLSSIPMDIEGDVFGKVYEYFLGKFAMAEGQRGGEFFTPTSLVKLIVEIIEPYHGRIYDPACGSGGMFVQSAKFIERHQAKPSEELAVYGQEKTAETIRLAKMNLAVNGLSGEIRQGNTFYEDIHNSVGKFDFVMANPPFNVSGVDKEKVKDDKRFNYGVPRTDNANYLWIQTFLSALNDKGRAGFVMANSASDARQSEMDIRKQIIQDGFVDVMVSIGSNFFYTVTLPCTLWFFDKGKANTDRKDKVLFLDARHVYRQIDKAHRDFSSDQVEFLSNIVRIYRGEEVETIKGSNEMFKENFPEGKYQDVKGLCNVATIDEIKNQGYSLNAGRYVGIAVGTEEDFDFEGKVEELNEEFEAFNAEAKILEGQIAENISKILGTK